MVTTNKMAEVIVAVYFSANSVNRHSISVIKVIKDEEVCLVGKKVTTIKLELDQKSVKRQSEEQRSEDIKNSYIVSDVDVVNCKED